MDHPEKPPLWQVKATRIIHNDQEKMIYFEDAHLDSTAFRSHMCPIFPALIQA